MKKIEKNSNSIENETIKNLMLPIQKVIKNLIKRALNEYTQNVLKPMLKDLKEEIISELNTTS